jgi:hypothetical protein
MSGDLTDNALGMENCGSACWTGAVHTLGLCAAACWTTTLETIRLSKGGEGHAVRGAMNAVVVEVVEGSGELNKGT